VIIVVYALGGARDCPAMAAQACRFGKDRLYLHRVSGRQLHTNRVFTTDFYNHKIILQEDEEVTFTR